LLLLLVEVYVKLRSEHPLCRPLLQLADQAVVAEQPRAVLAPHQQLVEQFVVDRWFGVCCHVPLLGSLSWVNTQNSLHPPTDATHGSTASIVSARSSTMGF